MTGILLIDKPSGWTSHDVVAKLRGLLGERRIGHSGTLDPMATGLLVLFIGRATRAVEFAEAHDKRYLARLRLGISTDTRDIWGKTLSQREVSVARDELENALARFRGELLQTPPMYSAIKQGGKKSYELARAGIEAELPPRPVNISRLEILGFEDGDWLLDVACSKGTYIRSLCHDIGESLGCGGAMSGLRRTAAGLFSVDRAVSLEQVSGAVSAGEAGRYLLRLDELFTDYPPLIAEPEQERKLRNGAAYGCEAEPGIYRVYGESGEFLMLGELRDGAMKTIKNFFEL